MFSLSACLGEHVKMNILSLIKVKKKICTQNSTVVVQLCIGSMETQRRVCIIFNGRMVMILVHSVNYLSFPSLRFSSTNVQGTRAIC